MGGKGAGGSVCDCVWGVLQRLSEYVVIVSACKDDIYRVWRGVCVRVCVCVCVSVHVCGTQTRKNRKCVSLGRIHPLSSSTCTHQESWVQCLSQLGPVH